MKRFILKLIKLYQKTFSPDSGWLAYKHPQGFCRYYPNCSTYCYQAIEKYGVFKGGFKSFLRILRCHPFAKGGVDQV
ncbi:MAG: membrane protein insertion efficiency factor YidD [Candidatus Komeilibacteria bacterium RIFOXYA2_FULL_45_9]|nr:MAG: membrane protein insertion efficiency factor YidD [Candidatus Komeilibacteria bacterium RIFOXYC2_FULL_45_12]OGY94532.1 MAG: membrane protein insertion efficiency factor YidD [Candidatus Komeilibacteria bacterium RIFOXYA2_FULL_45_9]